MITKAMVDPESFPKAAERSWDLLCRISGNARGLLRNQRYEVLLINNMEMDNGTGQTFIETQSRWRKKKTVWQTQFAERPLWVQVETFWSMPTGRRLYISQSEKIEGRRRVLFRMTVHNRPLFVWAEEIESQRKP
jgi:hypothetical protein